MGRMISMSTGSNSEYVRRIVRAGLLIALALVIRNFGYMVYFAGAPGMRISFAGVFLNFAAIILGPLYGGISHALLDVLDFLIKPAGAYIPWITVNAFLSGAATGLIWKAIRNADTDRLRKAFLLLFILLGAAGAADHIWIRYLPFSVWGKMIGSLGKKQGYVTGGLVAVASVGLLLLGVNLLLKRFRRDSGLSDSYLKVLAAVLIPGVIVSTLNTYTLIIFIPALGKIGFLAFWIPRITEEIFMELIQAYIISFMYTLYRKYLSE